MTLAPPRRATRRGLSSTIGSILTHRDSVPSEEEMDRIVTAVRDDLVSDGPVVRTALVIEALGGVDRTARLLGVSKSQPSRWRAGLEQPSPEKARLLIDLDHVIARAQLLFEPEVARDWLSSGNGYLDGARPIDVLVTRGAAEVVAALDAAMQGAYS